MPYNTRKGRFWVAIGSPRAVRFIFAGMLIYALVIGGLMLGYANVQQCLANYSDDSAVAARTRADAAAQDRVLNARENAVDASDRTRLRADNAAILIYISAVTQSSGNPSDVSTKEFLRVRSESQKIFENNELERKVIFEQRARVEKFRSSAPPPDAPSETC